RANYFSDRGDKRFHRRRNRASLRIRDELWQTDGPAGGQNHGGGGIHFASPTQSGTGMGRDHGGRTRFSDYWFANDGGRERKNLAGGKIRETKNFVASSHGNFLSSAALGERAALRE